MSVIIELLGLHLTQLFIPSFLKSAFTWPPKHLVITIFVITPASQCGLTEAQSLDGPLPFFGYTYPLDNLILFCAFKYHLHFEDAYIYISKLYST